MAEKALTDITSEQTSAGAADLLFIESTGTPAKITFANLLGTELTALSSATAAGLALMDDADAEAQLVTLGKQNTITDDDAVFPSSGAVVDYVAKFAETMIVVDEKASGVHGGMGTTGTWVQRDLNLVQHNTITGASLASNQVILPAGNYLVRNESPGYGNIGRHRTRLRNVTQATTPIVGRNAFAGSTSQSDAKFAGIISVNANDQIALDHWVGTAVGTRDFGIESGEGSTELYSTLIIQRMP